MWDLVEVCNSLRRAVGLQKLRSLISMMVVIFSGTHKKGSGASYPVSLVGIASARFLAQQGVPTTPRRKDVRRMRSKQFCC